MKEKNKILESLPVGFFKQFKTGGDFTGFMDALFMILLNPNYLEPPGVEREKLFARVKQLYDDRSKSAHGHHHDDLKSFQDSYDLLKRSVIKMIETERVPTIIEIEKMILHSH